MDIRNACGMTVGIGNEPDNDERYVILHILNSVTVGMNEAQVRFLVDQLLTCANTIWPADNNGPALKLV